MSRYEQKLSEAMDTLMTSHDWPLLSNPEGLRAPPEVREYLEARLKRAFEMGWMARLSADCDEIAKRHAPDAPGDPAKRS